MNIKEPLNERLRSLRKENGYTQQQVADGINTSRSAYSQYELGIKQPTLETVIKIAEFYRCSLDYVVGRI